MHKQLSLRGRFVSDHLIRTSLLGTKSSLAVAIKEGTPSNDGATSPPETARIPAKVRQKRVGDSAFERGESEDQPCTKVLSIDFELVMHQIQQGQRLNFRRYEGT
jgi:hypothetical protein